MYHVRKKKIRATKQIQELSLRCGDVYSKALVLFWRVQRKKNIWLSKKAVQRLLKGDTRLHSQTTQACIDSFFNSLKAWSKKWKSGYKTAKPPTRLRKNFLIQYKGQAIKLKDKTLILPNGRKNNHIRIPWKHEKPVAVSIRVTLDKAEIIACYKLPEPAKINDGRIVAIDLGQIHLATSSDEWSISGRKLRATRRYQNKIKGVYARLQNRKNKGSKAWKTLQRSKTRVLTKLTNQISDITHKATTGIVSTLERTGVKTLVLGDLVEFREENNQGKLRNQENHQWNFHQVTWQLTYKARRRGMQVVAEKEHYTSSTCPICGERTKTNSRNFQCSKCAFKMHRDILGAKNILKKYLVSQKIDLPVVGGMAPPRGIRLTPNTSVARGFSSVTLN